MTTDEQKKSDFNMHFRNKSLMMQVFPKMALDYAVKNGP